MNKRNILLIVDDVETNRAILGEMFRDQFEIAEAENGKEAIQFLKEKNRQVIAVLLDVIMPVLDGFGVLEFMKNKSLLEVIPVILITSDTTKENQVKGYNYGAFDIIQKPFVPNIVMHRLKNAVTLYWHQDILEERLKEQAAKIEEQSKILKESNEAMIDALSAVVEFRNLESGEHVKRIKYFTWLLLNHVDEKFPEYNLDEEKKKSIVKASSMHDIGKIGISDAILLKPGKLTREEFTIMKQHTIIGCDILKQFSYIQDKEFYQYCYDICRSHHERWNGRGYPDGLAGDDIPISAQVVSIADVYDALVSKRVYKCAYAHEEAVQMILDGQCGIFSPKLLECFKDSEAELKSLLNSSFAKFLLEGQKRKVE